MTGDLPIGDGHQHFWDPPRTPHPWLSTAPLLLHDNAVRIYRIPGI